MADDRILIAGGGIGGLAAALGLARKGFKTLVMEQMPELKEIGAGIQLGPNAFHSFDYFGIGDAAREKAVFIDKLVVMDAMEDAPIMDLPLDEAFRARFRNPYAVVHRADLHTLLLDACEASGLVDIKVNAHVTGFEQNGISATALLENGEQVSGTALIGADGLRSAVRAQIIGDGEPRISGHTTYRAVIETERMPEELRWNAATLWAGPKIHIVHYPLKGGKVINLVATRDTGTPEALAGKPVSKDEVHAAFAHVCERAQAIIASGDKWRAWVLCDRDPNGNWTQGRVTLLGDAAHPMLQYFAQGACMAMEDAVCLAHAMEHHDGQIEPALETYNTQRAVRTARLQMKSRLIGEYIYHPDGVQAQVRNTIMRSFSVEEYYNRFEWLYGGNGLESSH